MLPLIHQTVALVRCIELLSASMFDTHSIEGLQVGVWLLFLGICIFPMTINLIIFALFSRHLTVVDCLDVAPDAHVLRLLRLLRGQVKALVRRQIVTVFPFVVAVLLALIGHRFRLIWNHYQGLGRSVHFEILIVERADFSAALGANQGHSRSVGDLDGLDGR